MAKPLVSVIDDDESVRESLPGLIKAFGFAVCAFSSAEEFLESGRVSETQCLILDVTMPGMSGPELQRELKSRQLDMPIIFITGHGDVPMTVQAMKAGAVEFLTKPFDSQELLHKVATAVRLTGDEPEASKGASGEWRAGIITRSPRMEDLLRQALEIFQRTGAAEAADVSAELQALTEARPATQGS